jgi:hypothetical protein
MAHMVVAAVVAAVVVNFSSRRYILSAARP